MKVRTALFSVTDKSSLVELAGGLQGLGVKIVATSGTASHLERAGIRAVPLQELTGANELMDGRVKTLHPKVFAAILAKRSDPKHLEEAKAAGIECFDMVVANLYRFEEAIGKPSHTLEDALENIDIGGVALLRAAAKNFQDVLVLCDPADYSRVLEVLKTGDGDVPLPFRRELASKAFQAVLAYDSAIARYFAPEGEFPGSWDLFVHKVSDLRYGENPHQRAALYRFGAVTAPGVANSKMLGGKELSYNNILDADGASELVLEFAQPACAVVKHTTPCGAALGDTIEDAFRKALDADPKSAFGGIAAFNRPVSARLADAFARKENFFEVILAPGYEEAALATLKGKVKWGANLRILELPGADRRPAVAFRSVRDGLLAQTTDDEQFKEFTPVVGTPTPEEEADLKFAWLVAKHTKSNAIVIAKNQTTAGIGQGQTSRVDACWLAVQKARGAAKGAVAASDAFFPFPDGLELLIDAGVTAVAHPGGSVRDEEVLEVAKGRGCKVVLTRMRHFRH